jgi:hypothetical protein
VVSFGAFMADLCASEILIGNLTIQLYLKTIKDWKTCAACTPMWITTDLTPLLPDINVDTASKSNPNQDGLSRITGTPCD